LTADATVPAAPAARRNDLRLHFVDLIKDLLHLSGVHFDDDIISKRKKKSIVPISLAGNRGCLVGHVALSPGERVSRDGAFSSRRGTGEGLFPQVEDSRLV
jgi:hypothetical protein